MLRDRRLLAWGLATLAPALVVACAVEVGNPRSGGPSKPGTSGSGTVTLSLADVPADGAKHVYLNLQSLTVRAKDSGNDQALTLAASGRIDAMQYQGDDGLTLVSGQALPAGDYSVVRLALDKTKPVTMVGADGTEVPVTLGSAGDDPSVVVQDAFTVVDGQESRLTLQLDLRRSIETVKPPQGGPATFAFDPLAALIPAANDGSIAGKTTGQPDGSVVCAYLFVPPPPVVPGGPLPPPPPPPPPLPGLLARTPPSFVQGATDATKDSDASCPHAFATAIVTSGLYKLWHLPPGLYDLRLFPTGGGAPQDIAKGVGLLPAEQKSLTLP